MDQLLAQLSKTKYSNHLIVKGGFLLTTTYGLENRATGDIDFTVEGLELNEDNIMSIIESLQTLDVKQTFEFKGIKKTREDFDYNGYELKLMFRNDEVKIPLNVDLTTGESLIKMGRNKNIKSIFTDEEYSISGYPVEQILSDKFYTLLAYGKVDDSNSRMKDYYDLYLLPKIKRNIDMAKINEGLDKTMNQRNNYIGIDEYNNIIDYLKHSANQGGLWSNFAKNMPYAKGISFNDVIEQIKLFSNQLINKRTLTKETKD